MIYLLLVGCLSISDGTHQTYSRLRGHGSLSKPEQLKTTFQIIQSKILPPVITYNPSFGKTYIIQNVSLQFDYLDADQQASFVQYDTVRIKNGRLSLKYQFNFQKKLIGASIKGNASGSVISDKLEYVKNIELTIQEQPRWNLVNFSNFNITNLFNIERMTPPQADESIYQGMLNDLNGKSLKDLLVGAIKGLYEPVLNDSLHNQIFHYNHSIIYTYYPSDKPPQQINYTANINLLLLDQQLLALCYQLNITGYDDFQYGQNVPSRLLDPAYYGQSQTFFSFKLLQSTMRYAIMKKWFDSSLNAAIWKSNYFTFRAGDLFDAVQGLDMISPRSKIKAQCYTLLQGSSLSAYDKKSLRASLLYNCQIFYQKQDNNYQSFGNATPSINFQIDVSAHTNNMYLIVEKVQVGSVTYNLKGGFKLVNKPLADFLLNSTVQAMKGQHVFGNGFQIQKRDNPNIYIDTKWLFIYDSNNQPKSDY